MKCPNFESQQWKDLAEKLGALSAYREFLKYGDIPSADNYPATLKSIKTRSAEKTKDVLKEEAGSRFINIEQFNPYQEAQYTQLIVSGVIQLIGNLKPGQDIVLSPAEAFQKVKADFGKTANIYLYLAEKLDSNDKLNQAKADSNILTKFPILKNVTDHTELLDTANQYLNIVDNFKGFEQAAKIKMRKLGLKISEGDERFEEYGLSEEYYQDLIKDSKNIEDGEVEDLELSEREGNESFEDGSVFLINPRDTASTRVKLLFSTIPDVTPNKFGMKNFISIDDIIEDILTTSSKLDVVTYDNLVNALMKRVGARPYLKNLVIELAKIKKSNNYQLINDIVTFANKAYQKQVLIKYTKTESGIVSELIELDRDSTVNRIVKGWTEQKKNSRMLTTNKNGELIINMSTAKEIKDKFDAIRNSKDINQKKEWVKEFFNVLNLGFTDPMIDEFVARANAGVFKRKSNNATFDALFGAKGTLDILVNAYAEAPVNGQEKQYVTNNPIKKESTSFKLLADIFLEYSIGKYHTGSFRNGENKSIWSYILPSYLENTKKKLKGLDYVKTLLTKAFSRSSEVIKRYKESLESNDNTFKLEFDYSDSLKENKKSSIGSPRKKLSKKEQYFDAFLKHQNQNQSTGRYNIFTLSDKTTTPLINITKEEIKYSNHFVILSKQRVEAAGGQYNAENAIVFKKEFKDKLYNLVESEINRMQDYVRMVKENSDNKLNIAGFDSAFKFFYIFPILNRDRYKDIINKIHNGEELSSEDITEIKEAVTQSFKMNAIDSFKNMVEMGLIVKQEVNKADGTKTLEYAYPFFDKAYMNNDFMSKLDSIEKGFQAIIDFKFNNLRAQVTALQVLQADPALYYKNSAKGKTFDQLTEQEKKQTVELSIDNFSKRAAQFIAPGSQGSWIWLDKNGNQYNASEYDTVVLKDVIKKDIASFTEVNTTDAQELITMQEHIDRMFSEGRIPDKVWQSITDKIEKSIKDGSHYYELTEDEKKIVLQPTKPVQTNSTNLTAEFNRVDYNKSSTDFLLPEREVGSERNKLRIWMEKNKIRSASYESAKKIGQPESILTVFDENGNFTEPTKEQLEKSRQTLSRDGLYTQQEIPYQKSEITNISQMNRTLFDGLLDVDNFEIGTNVMSGADLKKLKENVRINLFNKKLTELNERLGLKDNDRLFVAMLIEEAIERGFNSNDIASLKLDDKGKLVMPLWMHAKSEKFEGLINSLYTKVVRLKDPGSSFVQVSSAGVKINFSDLDEKTKSDIIWSDKFIKNNPKGTSLNYIKKGKFKNEPAQVIVSQYLADAEGNIINLAEKNSKGEYIYLKEKNGIKTLDFTKVDPSLLQLVGSRIPNQSHPSMIPIEVVGFLPSHIENVMVIPDGVTAQMGSDFDVDKIYAYSDEHKYRYSKEYTAREGEIKAEIEKIKSEYQDAVRALHDEYLTDEQRADLAAAVSKYKEVKKSLVEKLKWNISDKEKASKQAKIDKINTAIEKLYEEADKNIIDKVKKEQLVLTTEKNKKLNALKAELKDLKKDRIVGIDKIDYNLDKYDGSFESISKFSESQLNQLYKDIHWSVLTNPATYDRMVKSIDLNDIKNISDKFKANGLFAEDQNFIPFDVDNQIKIFNDNLSGKTGTGVFANLGSFLADNQDKNIRLGFIDQSGKEKEYFINVKNKKGEVIALGNITKQGRVVVEGKNGVKTVRTKGDNNNIALTESLDNAKNKNLFKFNLSSEVMSAMQAIIALSTKKGEIVDFEFITNLMPQEIIKDYLTKLSALTDTFNDTYVADPKTEALNFVIAKYVEQLSEEAIEKYSDKNYKDAILGANELFDLLLDAKDGNKDDKYYLNQIAVLNLFKSFDDIGTSLSPIMSSVYPYAKGIGSTVFQVVDNKRKLGNLSSTNTFLGLEELAGPVSENGNVIEPVGEIGYSIKNSIGSIYDTYLKSSVFPIQVSNTFQEIVESIMNQMGIDPSKVGSDRFIKVQKTIFKGLKNYVSTNSSLNLFDNAENERYRLLINTESKPSLAKRIANAIEKNPELKENYLLNSLDLQFAFKYGEFDTVKYNNPFSENVDEEANIRGFYSLVLSDNPELQEIAKDLAIYPFITDVNQMPGTFYKFIPFEYYSTDSDFVKGLSKLTTLPFEDGFGEVFIKQFIQNNPDMAKNIPSGLLKYINRKDEFSFPKDKENKDLKKLMVKPTKMEAFTLGIDQKFPDYITYMLDGDPVLFQRISSPLSATYKRISVLGSEKTGVEEYSFGVNNLKSSIVSNLTTKEKFEALVNKENNILLSDPKYAENPIWFRELILANEVTKYIGFDEPNLKGGDNSHVSDIIINFGKDRANVNTYTGDDVVMITGQTLSSKKSDDNTYTISELQKLFEDKYKPLIDAARSNKVVFKTGVRSGMDTIVKEYLLNNGYYIANKGYQSITLKPKTYGAAGAEEAYLEQLRAEDEAIQNALGQLDENFVKQDDIFSALEEQGFDNINILDVVGNTFNALNGNDEVVNMEQLALNAKPTVKGEPVMSNSQIFARILKENENNSLQEVLGNIAKTTTNPFYKQLVDIMLKSGVPTINVITSNKIDDPGAFDFRKISINTERALIDNPKLTREQNLENTIMHEALHAYTANLFAKYKSNKAALTSEQMVYVKAVTNLFEATKEKLMNDPAHKEGLQDVLDAVKNPEASLSVEAKSYYYGFTSVDEFASMVMSDATFQNFLNTIQYSSKDQSAFARFKEILTRLIESLAKSLNINVSNKAALSEAVSNIVGMVQTYSQVENQSTAEQSSVKPVINIYWGSPESSTNTKVLSNLAPRKFTYQGKEYGSVEHAYQTLKSGSFDQATYDKYVKAGGYGTKIRGKAVEQGFDNLQLMRDLVVESFKQNPEQAKLLLNYSDFTHTTNEVIDKAFLDGVRLAQKNAEKTFTQQQGSVNTSNKLFNSEDKELKKGSVVEYNGEKYLFWNKNVAGKAQLIKTDGSKFSGTPDVDKLTVLGSYKTVLYNKTEYIVTDNNNIYSGATGNLVYTKSDPGSVAQKNKIIQAAKLGNLKSIKTENIELPLEYELKNQCKL